MKNLSAVLSRYAKFIAAIVGAVTEAINLNLLPHSAQNYVSVAVSILTALGVAGVTNGPALADGTALANDLASLKEQIGPLPPKGGLVSITKHLAQLAEQHGKNLEAIVEAGKASIEDLLHQPAVSMPDPPSTVAGTLTPVSEPTTPGPEPTEPTPEPDPLAALAALIGPVNASSPVDPVTPAA